MPKKIKKTEQFKFTSGANIDTRSDEEKLKDYHFGEIVAAANPVNWIEKPQSAWRKFPIFNQDGSGSCVAQTMAKLLGILYWLKNQLYVHFSATYIYQQRTNKPGGGMQGVDAFNIARNGVTLEELVPSQNMNDAQMDAVVVPQYKKDVGSVFKVPNYVSLPIDIDAIASIIQTTNKGVMVWFYATMEEWNRDVPIIIDPNLQISTATVRHSLAAVDFTLYQGKKALIIDESWGPNAGISGQRVITEDFFNARKWFAAYPINFVFFEEQPQPQPQPQPAPVKPKYTFTKSLVFIPWDSVKNQPADLALHESQKADVIALQNILRYEGFFPSNVASTGYYGSITAKAIYSFQVSHKVAPMSELDSLRGRRVGEKTIKALNDIYSL